MSKWGTNANSHQKMGNGIEEMKIMENMKRFDDAHNDSPIFKVIQHHMRVVIEMLLFTTAVRIADWELHLIALEMFTKYFFAHDQINCARMVLLYLAEMKALPDTDPEIYAEFQDGNWAVNKTTQVPFCVLGADNAKEHINRSMKVTGWNHTNELGWNHTNPTCSNEVFLIAPELARLADQAKNMEGESTKAIEQHHKLTAAVKSREEKSIDKLSNTIRSYTNPFTQEGRDLYNLVTKKVVSTVIMSRAISVNKALSETKFLNERKRKDEDKQRKSVVTNEETETTDVKNHCKEDQGSCR